MLPKAIESVLNQDFPHIALNIYDNCSNDETRDVVANYIRQDDRISYHCHPENIGAAANYSYALKEVDTPFFSFLADDDWLLPSFCSSALAAFEEFPASQFVFGRTVYDSSGTMAATNAALYQPGIYSQPDGMLALLKNGFPPWIGILFRTEALQDIGMYVTEADGIDFGFLLRASHLEYAVFPRDVAVFRSHPGSASGQLSLGAVWPSHMDAARTFLESSRIPQGSATVLASLLHQRISRLIYTACRRALRIHDYEEAKSAASILRTHFRKRAEGLLLGVLAALMRRSVLLERMIDAAYRWKTRGASLLPQPGASSPVADAPDK
jgi:glycosyltransferase involved in cell wall biosynthesis